MERVLVVGHQVGAESVGDVWHGFAGRRFGQHFVKRIPGDDDDDGGGHVDLLLHTTGTITCLRLVLSAFLCQYEVMNTSRVVAPHEAPSATGGGMEICVGHAAPHGIQGERVGAGTVDHAADELGTHEPPSANIRQLREQVGGALVCAGTASEVSR